jgi:UDP:flavonoid glycosyltransferase YjiC (YdhE family)
MTLSSIKAKENRIGYFISPHGLGHAARAAGVMDALCEIDSSIRFEIFTTAPRWFFQDSLSGPFTYHSLLTDIGMVQKTPFHEDLSETLQCLKDFLPFDRSQMISLAKMVTNSKCQLILCDIAPMGIAVAREAGIPSVLIENFTWDWIYEGYTVYKDNINKYITYLQQLFESVDFHIQTDPVCRHRRADLTTKPVSRKIRTPREVIREKLGISAEDKAALITMGGIPQNYTFSEQLLNQSDVYFIIPGGSPSIQLRGNLILLPHRSDLFHPDLVNASDAVIGKVGYSTLAEVYHAGVPFGYIKRPSFVESKMLEAYIKKKMNGIAISEAQFEDGSWIQHLPALLASPRIRRRGPNGASQVAQFVCSLLNGKRPNRGQS